MNRPRLLTAVGVVAALLGSAAAHRVLSAAQLEPRVVEVVTERFRFTPAEIRVEAGTPLLIVLRSLDVEHGFRIADVEIDVEVPARGRGAVMVPFTAPPGRYVFECSIVCGAGHGFMRGVIVVTDDGVGDAP